LTDKGFKKAEYIQAASNLPAGLDSPVPIFETVLLVDNAKLIGNPDCLVTASAISVVH
jgi:hypothetical protein